MEEQSPLKPSAKTSEAKQQKPSFWKRQFNETPTGAQKTFDVIVGAILPVVLFVVDPIMFKGYGCIGLAVAYSAFVYLAVAFGIIALLVWLFAPIRTGLWTVAFAGAFYAGGFFAGIIGVTMLPISIFGLIAIIGVLGFLPFLVSWVYFRNAVRAFRLAASIEIGKAQLVGLLLAGVLVVVGIPYLIQNRAADSITRSADKIRYQQNPGDVATAINELRTTNIVCLGLCRPMIIDKVLTLPFDLMSYEEKNAMVEQITGAPPDATCIANTQYND